ncbi:MAG: glycosyltransferase family 39 protein [Planctomycetota bacterium]
MLWRLVRFTTDRPFWGDEAMLAINFYVRDFAGLNGPLLYSQLAPPAFLWISEAMTLLLGHSEEALRLVPALAGAAATVVFAIMAWRFLRPREALAAVAVLAASYFPLRHSVELKPYSVDLLVAALTVWLTLEIRRRPDVLKWVGLIATGVVGVWVSFTAVLCLGGATIWLLVDGWLRKEKPVAAWAMVSGGVVLASFVAMFLFTGDVRNHETDKYTAMVMWQDSFPPTDQPWLIPWWLLKTHAGRMLSYPNGGRDFGSTATLLLCLLGMWRFWRTGRRSQIALLLLPLLLGLGAAFAGKYPYGGSARTMQYAAIPICLLMGSGIALVLGWVLGRHLRRGHAAVVVLMVLAIGFSVLRDFQEPYRELSEPHARRAMLWLSSVTGPEDPWVFTRVEPSDAKIEGEFQLQSAIAASQVNYYAYHYADSPLLYAPPVDEVVSLPTERVILIRHGVTLERGLKPREPADTYRRLLAERFGPPQVIKAPCGNKADIHITVYGKPLPELPAALQER